MFANFYVCWSRSREEFIWNRAIYCYDILLKPCLAATAKRGKKKQHVKCNSKSCVDCRQAICGLKVFCSWLKRFVDERHVDDSIEVVVCPRFEMEPLEYKVYRRT